jgi:hypothetical protein
MRKAIIPLLCAGLLFACGDHKEADKAIVKDATTAAPATDKPQATEFADPKFMDMGKQYMSLLSAGKIDEWAAQFDENAVYQWSSGDSLTGRQAITNYWKERMGKVIDKISFTNDIWLPVKVNQPQRGPDMPGVWLMNWEQVDVTYKNGKRLQFWVHNDFHYNDAGKIDRVVQYLDRAPINAALGIK